MRQTYGKLLPGIEPAELSGKLIVIEGTDGAGRTTQIDLLKPWLEEQGRAVLDTGMARSSLAGDGIRRAKEGNNLGRVTQSLFYATDFVDRLENEIVPALRAGFIVLTDRYIYSLMARAMVRGVDPNWVRKLYRMALKPDAIFYLRLGVEQLVPRVAFSRGFDYWESGMDYYPARDMYEGFCNYQKALLAEFDRLSAEYKFEIVDASADARAVFGILKARIVRLLEPPSLEPRPAAAPVSPERAPQPPAPQPNDAFNEAARSGMVAPAADNVAAQPSVGHSDISRAHISGAEISEAELESLIERAWQLTSLRRQAWARARDLSPAPQPQPKEIAELESLFERASKWVRSRKLSPAPQPNWEEVFELNLPPIASQISRAFELATQALAAGSQLGKGPVQTNGNGHSNGNGHGHGQPHGH